MAQAEIELVPFDRLPDGTVVPIKLDSNGRPDEVGSVGVEALLDEKVDMAQIDIAEVDRDLLAICSLRPKFMHIVCHGHHPHTISMDGRWQVHQATSTPTFDLLLNPIRLLASISLASHPECEHGHQREI
jgi:hypothetical protein